MSVELPKFITREFLQNLVRKYLKDETTLTIDNFWGDWATKRGENYASDMYRLHVDYTHKGASKRKSVLLKVRYFLVILEFRVINFTEFLFVCSHKNQHYQFSFLSLVVDAER